jgi:hypothetical protein
MPDACLSNCTKYTNPLDTRNFIARVVTTFQNELVQTARYTRALTQRFVSIEGREILKIDTIRKANLRHIGFQPKAVIWINHLAPESSKV